MDDVRRKTVTAMTESIFITQECKGDASHEPIPNWNRSHGPNPRPRRTIYQFSCFIVRPSNEELLLPLWMIPSALIIISTSLSKSPSFPSSLKKTSLPPPWQCWWCWNTSETSITLVCFRRNRTAGSPWRQRRDWKTHSPVLGRQLHRRDLLDCRCDLMTGWGHGVFTEGSRQLPALLFVVSGGG